VSADLDKVRTALTDTGLEVLGAAINYTINSPFFPPYFPPFFPPFFPPPFPPVFCTPTCTLQSSTGPGAPVCPGGAVELVTTYYYSCSGCSPCNCPAPPPPTSSCPRT
jgi:hypothetical protein